jgi:hypothetical protein
MKNKMMNIIDNNMNKKREYLKSNKREDNKKCKRD